MTNDYTDAVIQAVAETESQLAEASMQLSRARINFNVAAIKYAALRDEAWERLGGGPHRVAEWPSGRRPSGKFRFVEPKPAKAMVEALRDGMTRSLSRNPKVFATAISLPPRSINPSARARRIERAAEGEPARYERRLRASDLPF